jgi:hypothetical protein
MLLELSIDLRRVHNRNVNALMTALNKAKRTVSCRAILDSQKLALVVAFAGILAALTLSACGQKTEAPGPGASPTEPLATPSLQPTIGQSPTTTEPTSPSDYEEDSGERGVDDEEAMPEFPWPPPTASASDVIPRGLLVGNAAHPTLSTVAQAIESAFEQAGYGKKSYYSVPGGFAMASQFEQINQDGSPSIDRWSSRVPPLRKWSLSSYLNALFTAQPGYYRVIVFIVTSKAFSQDDVKVTSEQGRAWVASGSNRLSEEIGNQEYSPAYSCTALIYEFKQTGKHAELVDPSQIIGKTHLEKAGLMAAFAKRP